MKRTKQEIGSKCLKIKPRRARRKSRSQKQKKMPKLKKLCPLINETAKEEG
jgi:hypothetical protein